MKRELLAALAAGVFSVYGHAAVVHWSLSGTAVDIRGGEVLGQFLADVRFDTERLEAGSGQFGDLAYGWVSQGASYSWEIRRANGELFGCSGAEYGELTTTVDYFSIVGAGIPDPSCSVFARVDGRGIGSSGPFSGNHQALNRKYDLSNADAVYTVVGYNEVGQGWIGNDVTARSRSVPEPASLKLVGIGLASLLMARRQRVIK